MAEYALYSTPRERGVPETFRSQWRQQLPASNVWNAQQIMENIYRLEHLSKLLHAEIIPFHDIAAWKEMKKVPEFYD
jgi:hypothetical protein